MNDLFNAVSSRIKAPYFGYSLLAFIAFNWRGMFLLIMSEGSASERLLMFDSSTSIWSLLVLPLASGGVVAFLSPWIAYFFHFLSMKPYEKREFLSLEFEHKKILKKTELERARSQLLADKEIELIERVKRDGEVAQIKDPEAQDNLKKAIESLRRGFDRGGIIELNSSEAELIKAAVTKDGGVEGIIRDIEKGFIQVGPRRFGADSNSEFVRFDNALEGLVSKGLVVKQNESLYEPLSPDEVDRIHRLRTRE